MLACKRCASQFTVSSFASEFAAHIDDLMTAGQNVSAIRDMRNTLGCDLPEAILLFEHLQIVPGHCNHCRASLPNDAFLDCPSCTELNINLRRLR